MMPPAAKFLLLALGLSALAACSRTTDGTMVPSYQMTVDEFAGIPYLSLRRTPLDGPDPLMPAPLERAAFPPAPPPPQEALPAEPERRQSARTSPRRARPAVASAPAEPLACRNDESGERVRIVCE